MKSAADAIFSHKDLKTLWCASRKRFRKTSSGIDARTVDQIEPILNRYISDLRVALTKGYKPEGLLAIPIKKTGSDKIRVICVPTYADRLIQFALQEALRPDLNTLGIMNKVSFGIVRGAEFGVEKARDQACTYRGSKNWVYKTDIVAFFDQIPRDQLKQKIVSTIKKRSFHKYLIPIVDTEIERGVGADWKQKLKSTSIKTGLGIRQGMPLSPLLSALYLIDFDKRLIEKSIPAIRYVDDFVAFFSSEKECIDFHEFCVAAMDAIGLEIGPPNTDGLKTKIYSPSQPAEFLGMEITPPTENGRSQLIVSSERLGAIRETVELIGDLNYLNSNGIHFQRLESHAASITNGLCNAYRTAHNINQVTSEVRAAALTAQDRVICEVFGQTFLSTLEPAKRTFLGLRPKSKS